MGFLRLIGDFYAYGIGIAMVVRRKIFINLMDTTDKFAVGSIIFGAYRQIGNKSLLLLSSDGLKIRSFF